MPQPVSHCSTQPEVDGLDRWTAAMQQVCGRFQTELAFNRALFIGEIATFNRAGLALANLRTNAGNIRRFGDNPDRDDDQHCFLVSQRMGYWGWGSNGTESALKLSRCPANPCNVWIVSKNDRFMKPFPLSRGKVTNTRKSVQ